MRIVSLCPSNTELLHFIGLGKYIVGIDNNSDHPPELSTLPRVGPDLNIDMDRVQSLQPDLVVASLSVPGMEKNITKLKEYDLPHITLNPNSLKDIGENILEIGKAVNQKPLIQRAYEHYCYLYEECKREAKRIDKRYSIYWEWWPRPIFTPGHTNWLTEVSELSGGQNIYQSEKQASVETTWDEVKRRNPKFIFLSWTGVEVNKIKPEILKKRHGWKSMDAFNKDRVFVLGDSPFCRPSPRLLIGIKRVRNILHPELFPSFDEQEAERWLLPY